MTATTLKKYKRMNVFHTDCLDNRGTKFLQESFKERNSPVSLYESM